MSTLTLREKYLRLLSTYQQDSKNGRSCMTVPSGESIDTEADKYLKYSRAVGCPSLSVKQS